MCSGSHSLFWWIEDMKFSHPLEHSLHVCAWRTSCWETWAMGRLPAGCVRLLKPPLLKSYLLKQLPFVKKKRQLAMINYTGINKYFPIGPTRFNFYHQDFFSPLSFSISSSIKWWWWYLICFIGQLLDSMTMMVMDGDDNDGDDDGDNDSSNTMTIAATHSVNILWQSL